MKEKKQMNPKKPSAYKRNDRFADGSIMKKKYFYNDESNYIIYLDDKKTVRYKVGSTVGCLDELEEIGTVVTELSIVPNFFKTDLNLFLAKTYEVALIGKKENSKKNLDDILEMIQERKKILKKIIYLATPFFLTAIFYTIYYLCLQKVEIINMYKSLVLFAGIGNYISIAHNLKDIEFNTYETPRFYFIFAMFKYFTSIISALIIMLLYKSGIINVKFSINDENLLIAILSVVGGYAEIIVPNIFEKISKSITEGIKK